jgi:hypothetical protein
MRLASREPLMTTTVGILLTCATCGLQYRSGALIPDRRCLCGGDLLAEKPKEPAVAVP